jgi:hypothetical protein
MSAYRIKPERNILDKIFMLADFSSTVHIALSPNKCSNRASEQWQENLSVVEINLFSR